MVIAFHASRADVSERVESTMKLTVSLLLILFAAAVLASDEDEAEFLTESSESSTESSASSSLAQEIQMAGAVKRDAERYLAGSDMTRALKLRLTELQVEHPELESDELVDYALADAVATLAQAERDAAAD